MRPALEIENLTVSYGPCRAVEKLNVTIPQNQVTAIIGPNGSGKTTLLKAILGLLPLQEGIIRVLGQTLEQTRNSVAYVPQKEDIDWSFPLLVQEVVAMGRYKAQNLLKPLNKKDREIINQSLENLGLTALSQRPIGHLSGGQKQRVFLARAMARQASLYLLDEPFNGVDASTSHLIMSYIQGLKEEGKTMIIVHHKLDEVYDSFDLTLLMNRHLISFGPTRELFQSNVLEKVYAHNTEYPPSPKGEQPCLLYSSS